MADSKDRKRQHAVDTIDTHDVIKMANKDDTTDTYFDRSNVDCLEHIFNFLGPFDLYNVAELNSTAAKAAEIVYARHFSKLLVKIHISDGHYTRKPTIVDDSKIRIYKPNVCTKFVQKFGKFFNALEVVDFGYHRPATVTPEWQEAIQMINKECGNNLIHLTLDGANPDICNEFQSVFEKVDTLDLNQVRIGILKNQLKNWFPSLKHLNLTNHEDISAAKEVIGSSPQLESLKYNSDGDVSFIRFVNEVHPMLKVLEVSWPYVFHRPVDQSPEKISFKNVEKFTIYMRNNLPPVKFPFAFERLTDLMVGLNERIDIHFNEDDVDEAENDNDEEDLDDREMAFDIEDEDQVAMAWIDFASEQGELTKLQLDMRGFDISKDYLSKLFNGVPQLNEFELLAKLNFDAIAYILTRGKSLHTFTIDYPSKDVHDLCTKLSNRWIMEEDESLNTMTFKRKLTQ